MKDSFFENNLRLFHSPSLNSLHDSNYLLSFDSNFIKSQNSISDLYIWNNFVFDTSKPIDSKKFNQINPPNIINSSTSKEMKQSLVANIANFDFNISPDNMPSDEENDSNIINSSIFRIIQKIEVNDKNGIENQMLNNKNYNESSLNEKRTRQQNNKKKEET